MGEKLLLHVAHTKNDAPKTLVYEILNEDIRKRFTPDDCEAFWAVRNHRLQPSA